MWKKAPKEEVRKAKWRRTRRNTLIVKSVLSGSSFAEAAKKYDVDKRIVKQLVTERIKTYFDEVRGIYGDDLGIWKNPSEELIYKHREVLMSVMKGYCR